MSPGMSASFAFTGSISGLLLPYFPGRALAGLKPPVASIFSSSVDSALTAPPNFAKFGGAVKALSTELLKIEATGGFNPANALPGKYGKSNPEIDPVNAKLADIPGDITPASPAAGAGQAARAGHS